MMIMLSGFMKKKEIRDVAQELGLLIDIGNLQTEEL